jgi:hypothetical protein
MKKYEMGMPCSICGREEKCVQSFSRKKLNEGDQFDSLAIDGWIVLKWILK